MAVEKLPQQRSTFDAFNLYRFLAACAVTCFHFVDPERHLKTPHPHIDGLLQSGPVALPFFFLLSGYVLAHAYRNRAPRSRNDRAAFWRARFARLFPVYFLASVLFVPIAVEKYLIKAHEPHHFLTAGLLNLTMLQARTPNALSWNGPSWSLSVEMGFYAAFPLIYRTLIHMRAGRLVLLSFGLWSIQMILTGLHLGQVLPEALWHRWIQYNPIFWSPLFLGGIVLYLVTYPASLTCSGATRWVGALCSAVLFALLAGGNAGVRDLLASGASAPFFAMIIFASSGMRVRHLATARLWGSLGAASYGMYILQSPVWHFFETLWARSLKGPRSVEFGIFLPVHIAICLWLVNHVEQPAKEWLTGAHLSRTRRPDPFSATARGRDLSATRPDAANMQLER